MNTIDQSVNTFFQTTHTLFLDKVFSSASWLFDPLPFTVILVVSLFVVYKKFGQRTTLFLLSSFVLAFVITWSLKFSLNIARPAHTDISIFGPSFPSGHTAVSFAYFFSLIHILHFTKETFRRYVHILFCVLFPVFVGVSRLYLGVHWLSDVLGGCIIGILSVRVCLYLLKKV